MVLAHGSLTGHFKGERWQNIRRLMNEAVPTATVSRYQDHIQRSLCLDSTRASSWDVCKNCVHDPVHM